MTRHRFSLTAARAPSHPLPGPSGFALGSLVAGFVCLLAAALSS